ncbi:MAG: TetR/AcrR family transcriptional regulator [Clostridiales bacterium]|nr:TetR/AcrR family transcriptional regulator [Clostridiales bacterium]
MPKIIENLQQKLIEEARKQAEAGGYAAVTIRSVAKACGVGVGTVYNYFPSKDALLAAYMLEGWKVSMAAISAAAETAEGPEPVLQAIHDQLLQYAAGHRGIIGDRAAASAFAESFRRYHAMLRSQLAAPLRRFCESDFTAEFAAEALLTWTLSGKSFEDLWSILQKLF